MTLTSVAVLQDIETAEGAAPLAYSPASAERATDFGHNVIVDAMNAGELVARKYGRRTVILREDLLAWLRSLPRRTAEDNTAAKRAAAASVRAARSRRDEAQQDCVAA